MSENKYFFNRFAERLAPTLAMMAPDRTRRALSIALVGVQNGPFLMSQKREIPTRMPQKPSISLTDSLNDWLQLWQ